MNHCLIGGCNPPYHFANLTDQEYFNLRGTLTSERIQELIDQSALVEAASEAKSALQDALGVYPCEDCLQSVIDDLKQLAKNLRGENKNEVNSILLGVEERQNQLHNQSEYGAEVINNFIRSLEK